MSSLISRSCSSGTPPRTRTLAATGHAHAAAESTLSRARAQIALAFHFYSQLFGWQKTDAMDMGPMGTSLPIPPKRVGQLDTAALPEFWQHLTLRRELDALAGGRGSGWRRLDARRKSATARSRSPAWRGPACLTRSADRG